MASVGLDKPFTGGIGSYKLYVMVAYLLKQQEDHVRSMSNECQSSSSSSSASLKSLPSSSINKIAVDKDQKMSQNRPDVDVKSGVDLGYLLVAFFHHFGNPNNLNSDTVVRIKLKAYRPGKGEEGGAGREGEREGRAGTVAVAGAGGEGEILEAEADFTRSMQILACQKLFQAAHTVLLGDLKSCTPSRTKGNTTKVGKSTETRNVRSLGWLRPQFDNGPSR